MIILLGYAGHGIVVAEAALLNKIMLDGYAAKTPSTFNPYELAYLGYENEGDFSGWTSGAKYILGIGDNHLRVQVAQFVREKGYDLLTIKHPDSNVSDYAEIDNGTFIARGVAVNPMCRIGKDVIINTSASLDHECTIAHGAHIAPGAVLAGNVKVGKNAFIGANSVIKQGLTIGENVVIGAGTVVLEDIAPNATVVGNPARKIHG